mmetsp:Transcript_4081/g.5919  ORF Transcript_4081/g.5919 Transcript_4081/m.5919 type:complete len:112 (+) Transcript_4081:271-606(+)
MVSSLVYSTWCTFTVASLVSLLFVVCNLRATLDHYGIYQWTQKCEDHDVEWILLHHYLPIGSEIDKHESEGVVAEEENDGDGTFRVNLNEIRKQATSSNIFYFECSSSTGT